MEKISSFNSYWELKKTLDLFKIDCHGSDKHNVVIKKGNNQIFPIVNGSGKEAKEKALGFQFDIGEEHFEVSLYQNTYFLTISKPISQDVNLRTQFSMHNEKEKEDDCNLDLNYFETKTYYIDNSGLTRCLYYVSSPINFNIGSSLCDKDNRLLEKIDINFYCEGAQQKGQNNKTIKREEDTLTYGQLIDGVYHERNLTMRLGCGWSMEEFFALTQRESIELKTKGVPPTITLSTADAVLAKLFILSDPKIKGFINFLFQTLEQQIPGFQGFIKDCTLCSLKSIDQLPYYQGSYFSSQYAMKSIGKVRDWVLFNETDLVKDKVNRLGTMPNSGNDSEE